MSMLRSKLLAGAMLAFALTAARGADKITYLGVVTAPVEPAVAAQAGLPEGVGVLVANVAEGSAAQGKLERYDVLHKVDGHVLTDPAQFADLIRAHKPGDEVKLLVVRRGKAEALRVKLGEMEAPPMPGRAWRRGFTTPPAAPNWAPNADFNRTLRDLRRRMEQLEQQWRAQQSAPDEEDEAMLVPPAPAITPPPGPVPPPSSRSYQRSESVSVVTEMRDGMAVTLTDKNGQRSVKAEEGGKVIFEGPANTPQELKAMPEKVRQRIKDMEQHIKIQIRTPAASKLHGVPL